MNARIPDRTTVRQYLLGRLDDKPAVESDLSERIFLSDDLSEMVDSVEDEIIEEYVDGALDSADKNAVEEYFLRPLERKEKLRFSRLLRHHFQTKQSESIATRVDALPGASLDRERVYASSAVHWRSHVRAYWQVAALVLLTVVSLTYISGIRKREGVLEAELVWQRERSTSPVKEAPLLQVACACVERSSFASNSSWQRPPRTSNDWSASSAKEQNRRWLQHSCNLTGEAILSTGALATKTTFPSDVTFSTPTPGYAN